MDLKPVEIRTDFWVGTNNVVMKFVEKLPEGADAESIEATLEE